MADFLVYRPTADAPRDCSPRRLDLYLHLERLLLGNCSDHIRKHAACDRRSVVPERSMGRRVAPVSAGSIIAALPPVLMFFMMQKHFIAGLTLGAVK